MPSFSPTRLKPVAEVVQKRAKRRRPHVVDRKNPAGCPEVPHQAARPPPLRRSKPENGRARPHVRRERRDRNFIGLIIRVRRLARYGKSVGPRLPSRRGFYKATCGLSPLCQTNASSQCPQHSGRHDIHDIKAKQSQGSLPVRPGPTPPKSRKVAQGAGRVYVVNPRSMPRARQSTFKEAPGAGRRRPVVNRSRVKENAKQMRATPWYAPSGSP